MRLVESGIQITGEGQARLWGRVRYDRADPDEEVMWFQVPGEAAPDLSLSGNPWAVCLLPLAMTRGEALVVDLPVSARLLRGVDHLQETWRSWYPWLHRVEVVARAHTTGLSGSRTGLFFSGGVDSSFSLLRHSEDPALGTPELLLVHGADLPLAAHDTFAQLVVRYTAVAEAFGTRLVPLVTNLRQTRWEEANWLLVSHGAFLAACGLALEGRYRRLTIASSNNPALAPLGSHPATDPLFSTETTEVVHDLDSNRLTKCATLAQSDLLLHNLRVCWQATDGRNCGNCGKCCRTMLALELLGVLDRCSLFPARTTDLRRVVRFYSEDPTLPAFFDQLRSLARETRRPDIDRALGGAERHMARVRFVNRMARKLEATGVLRGVAGRLRWAMLRRSVS